MDLREKIEALLGSDLSGYQVNKLTGISASKFTRLRTGTNSIDNLSLKTAEKLGEFYDITVLDLVEQGDDKGKVSNLKGSIIGNSDVNELFENLEDTDVDVLRKAAEQENDSAKRKLLFSMYNYTMAKKQAKIINEPGFTI